MYAVEVTSSESSYSETPAVGGADEAGASPVRDPSSSSDPPSIGGSYEAGASDSYSSGPPAVGGSEEEGVSSTSEAPAIGGSEEAGASDSDSSGQPAVGGSGKAGQERRQPQAREMPHRRGAARAAPRGRKGNQNIQGEAAKPVRRLQSLAGKRRLKEVAGQPRKAPSEMSRGSESTPFEAESQEGQLPSFRTEVRSFAARGGAPPFLPAFAGPAGCGDPAVGGEDGTVNCKTIKDIRRAMSQEEIDKYADKAAFGKTSLLWGALARETDMPGSELGSGKLFTEPVFYTFSVYNAPATSCLVKSYEGMGMVCSRPLDNITVGGVASTYLVFSATAGCASYPH